jgi:hypothetical protein
MLKAITPNVPLNNKILRLLPNSGILALLSITTQITNDIMLRNKTSSVTGKSASILTHNCINENAKLEISMYFTAWFM